MARSKETDKCQHILNFKAVQTDHVRTNTAEE